jgi:hydrogenase/urease accessory protein HupE
MMRLRIGPLRGTKSTRGVGPARGSRPACGVEPARAAWLASLTLLAAGLAPLATAHEIRPALLQITQQDPHHYEVLWKQPINGEVAVHLQPQLSGGALTVAPDFVNVTPSFALKIWKNVPDEPAALDGQTISVDGLQRTITDVLVNVTLLDGRTTQLILKPQHNTARLDLGERGSVPVAAYLTLGIEHILTGFDHLLFVFGLLLLVKGSWALLRTITAFTVAHSVTLAGTALGWIHVRPAVVEALVALSIVVLAVELVRHLQGESGFTSRRPWAIAFLFGLLHGCAFAGALAEVGLPTGRIPLALFLFNVGVEIGQLVFVAFACALLWVVNRLVTIQRPLWLRFATPYAIGTFAAYWFVERFLSAIQPGHIS